MAARLSVILCTRNRAGKVEQLLRQLQEQAARATCEWELVAVDNGSGDATPSVLEAVKASLPLHVVMLEAPGQTRARNAGIRASRGTLLVFVDDDVRLGDGWLAAWCDVAVRDAEEAWFGGRLLTDWDESKPAWVRDPDMDLIDGVLVRHNLGEMPRAYRAQDVLPVGANCAARRTSFEQVGIFREDLGHRGELRAIGDETEWFARARAHGLGGAYVPSAVAWHPALPERLSLRGLWEHGRATARGIIATRGASSASQVHRPAWWLCRGALQLFRGRGDRFRQCVIRAGMDNVMRKVLRERRKEAAGGADRTQGPA